MDTAGWQRLRAETVKQGGACLRIVTTVQEQKSYKLYLDATRAEM